MHMTRRALLRSLGALAATMACGGGPASAGNRAGLAPGSFVWQPRLSPGGALLIAYSAEDDLVRIYRGGIEIGISTCRGAAPQASGWSVFNASEESSRSPLAWSGTPIHAVSARTSATPLIELPSDLARLLAEATSGPSVVVHASAELNARMITGSALLPAGASMIETQSVDKTPDAPHGQPRPALLTAASTCLIVSSADRMAYLCRPGHPEIAGHVEVQEPGRALGDRLLSLVEMGQTAELTRWLALDLEAQSTPVEEALGRVSLSGRLTPYQVASAMGPGATLLLTDQPAPPSARKARRPVALLSAPGGTAPGPRRGSSRPSRPRSAALDGGIRPLRFFRDY